MVFAELEYPQHYDEFHAELSAFLTREFPGHTSGHQGDSWFWIVDGDEKVELDTFTSMKHQVKSAKDGALLKKVLAALGTKFKLRVFAKPEPEPHEGCD